MIWYILNEHVLQAIFWPTMEYILINISAEFGKNVNIYRII